ncbi:MAG: cell division protein ZapA [Candidatus Omnitrophica bacterium]|nr:cell division protein ZapA [Candidatus Omnitrophota bacterium]
MHKVNILGKTYSIYSSLPSEEISKIVKEINEKCRRLENEYNRFDKVDILIIYLIELYEMIYNLKKDLVKKELDRKNIKSKIEEIEKEIETILKT